MGAIAMNEKELLLIDTINKEKKRIELKKKSNVVSENLILLTKKTSKEVV